MLQPKLFILSILLVLSFQLSAKHILSGSMTYECLGNDTYEFTMIIYRDCFGGGASFDNPAAVSIYKNEDEYVTTIYAEIESYDVVQPIMCTGETIDYCSEKAVYKFTTSLFNEMGPYNVVYQRCCWSDIVANILEPEENGISVVSRVTNHALEICNTQTAIDMPLSFPACPGEEMMIPILPFDADGDSLSYEICMPYNGGGIVGTPAFPGDPNACDGVIPDPACPPPYTPLAFADGFDIDNPFPTVDGVNIDPVNQTISFTPTTQGIFIYGLCITEYRNGQVLGRQSHNIETTSAIDITNNNQEVSDYAWKMTQSHHQQTLFFTSNSGSQNGQITLHNIDGKIVSETNIDNDSYITISTDGLNAGIYFATLNTNGFFKTFKAMVLQ